jgi:hypothetical protein
VDCAERAPRAGSDTRDDDENEQRKTDAIVQRRGSLRQGRRTQG